MTQIDGKPEARRRRGTWSSRGPWNRATYALVIGWLVWWLALQKPTAWLILPLAAAAWLALTVHLALIDRHRWARDHS